MVEVARQGCVILLATFNGEAFLADQIDSILNQTYDSFLLLVRDDGSTDKTVEILRNKAAADSRIIFHPTSGDQSGSVVSNFAELMEYALTFEARWYVLSDQDDIWSEDKLEVLSREFELDLEDTPLLLVGGWSLIDESGEPISESKLNRLLVGLRHLASLADACSRNVFPGCTMAFNRKVLRIATPLPSSVLMHDWWLSIIIQSIGECRFIPRVLTYYRQHSANQIGSLRVLPEVWGGGGKRLEAAAQFTGTFLQAAAARQRLIEREGQLVSWGLCLRLASSLDLLDRYINLPKRCFFWAFFEALSLRIRANAPILLLPFMCRLLLESASEPDKST